MRKPNVKNVTKMISAAVVAALLVLAGFLLMGEKKEPPWRPGTPLPKEQVKIGVIYLTDAAVESSGYSYSHKLGIRKMQKKLGLKDSQILHKYNVSDLTRAPAEQAMRECLLEGANVIIATSWFYMDACERLAQEFPDVVFAHASGFKDNKVNFTNYFGRYYQPKYLSGIVAGLRTATNKIGYVAAMGKENSEVTSALDAFALGVERANPEARIYVKVLHRWFDPEGEAALTRVLIEEGCDVIAHDTDTPSSQIEAQKAGVWGIGYNTDMSLNAPGAVMTSILWKWDVYYVRLVQSVIDGSFTSEPYLGGLKEGIVDLAPLRLVPPGVAEAVAKARAEIESGANGVFDGVMKTNDGQTVGTAGSTLPDTVIREEIDWYYHNVLER